MVAPNFKKVTTELTVDPFNVRYGAPDLLYALNVLDGTHSTDRVQIQNVEGVGKLNAATWVIRKNGSNVEGVNTSTGAVVANSVDFNVVLANIIADSNFLDGSTIVIKPGTYSNCGAININTNIDKTITIWGYGATLIAVQFGMTPTPTTRNCTSANWLQLAFVDNKSITIYGLRMNGNQNYGAFVRGSRKATHVRAKNMRFYDCYFEGIESDGINAGYEDGGIVHDQTSIVIERCVFMGNISRSSNNEWLMCDSIGSIKVKDVYIDDNKGWYISARHVFFENVVWYSNGGYVDNTSLTGDPNFVPRGIARATAEGEFIEFRNIYVNGAAMEFRPFGDIHLDQKYASTKKILIDGLTVVGPGSTVLEQVHLEPYDTTYKFENVTLRNLDLSYRGIVVQTFDDRDWKAKIDNLSISDMILRNFDVNNSPVQIRKCDVDQLVVANVKVVPTWTTGSAVRLVSTTASGALTIGKADVRNFYTEPPNIFGGVRASALTATFTNTLENGSALSTTSGSAALTVKFKANRGKATLSGNGTTTTFNIAHGLSTTPTSPIVTPGSAAANGAYHVTADATNISVVYSAAPASGTNNVVLYWSAKSS